MAGISITPTQTAAFNMMLSHRYSLLYGGGRCLGAETLVLTIDGYKKIKDVNIGDLVPSIQENGYVEVKRVVDKFTSTPTEKSILFKTKNGENIICSQDHSFLFGDTYVEASDIARIILNQTDCRPSFDFVINGEFDSAQEISGENIISVEYIDHNETMYDIEVEHSGNFFITEDNIVSHNSGKTFIILFFMLFICNLYDPLKAKKDKKYPMIEPPRMLAVRFHFSDIKKSVIHETLPKVARLMGIEYKLNQIDWFLELKNGAQIWFGGVDESKSIERVLGKEYSIIWFNECSQISFSSFEFLKSRLAQKTGFNNRFIAEYAGLNEKQMKYLGVTGYSERGVKKYDGVLSELSNRYIFDENPPSKAHWTYRVFFEGIHPKDRVVLKNFNEYGQIQLNPDGNKKNIDESFFISMDSASSKLQKRFLKGEFEDETLGVLFTERNISQFRVLKPDTELKKVVVAIDPAVSTNEDSDETGIIVAGIGFDDRGYILEDQTGVYTPNEWAKKAIKLYMKWDASSIVGEINQGGNMVENTIKTLSPNIPFRGVHAKRGKILRAEPVSSLYDEGRISHVGVFPDLETEMTTYTGAVGEKSPNRLDAMVYAVSELFPIGMSSQRDLFGSEKLTFYDEEFDFTGAKTFSVIKIWDAKMYHFGMMIMKIKNGRICVTDILNNSEIPELNLPEIIHMLTVGNVSRCVIECGTAYAAFSRELYRNVPSTYLRTATAPDENENRILIESTHIKDRFVFSKKTDNEQYASFMKQLYLYTNISPKEDSFSAELCACASSMIKKFKDEYL